MVYEFDSEHSSEWAAITSIAPKIGCSALTLSTWIKRRAVDRGQWPGVRTEGQAQVKALERENRKLRRANETLRKSFVYLS